MVTILFISLKLLGGLYIGWFWIIIAIGIDVWPVNRQRELKNRIQELEEKIEEMESNSKHNLEKNY